MSNNESPVKTEYGVVCEIADTLKNAVALVKKSHREITSSRSKFLTKYMSQFDLGIYGEILIIIENPKKRIQEPCRYKDPDIPSTEIQYSVQSFRGARAESN
jgi:hypothetical protein